MKKLKLYLDTSVISYLDAQDTPEKMADTLALWQDIESGKYEVYISDIAMEELAQCSEPKKTLLLEHISTIEVLQLREAIESLELANTYIQYGVLNEKSRADCRHIAIATIAEMDYIVSWNFKHFVNINTINKVQAINQLLGYKAIKIISPSMLL